MLGRGFGGDLHRSGRGGVGGTLRELGVRKQADSSHGGSSSCTRGSASHRSGWRHGAATLAHAAGADLNDIQEMLGHSPIAITADARPLTQTAPDEESEAE